MLLKPLIATVCISFALPVAAQQTYEFSFWPLESAKNDPRLVEILQGPCGSMAVARVQSIPGPGDKSFESEVVFHLSATSSILRSWRTPVNSYPIAVEGESLIFRDGLRTFKTTPAGAVSPVKSLPILAESTEAQCKMPKAFARSAYARCWAVPRIGSQSKAVLALQGPCT